MESKKSRHSSPNWFGIAVQALVFMARNELSMVTSREIAHYLQVESSFLRRVLILLTEEGLLESKEGRSGGFRLRKSPEAITLGEVYRFFYTSVPISFHIKDKSSDTEYSHEQLKVDFTFIMQMMDQRIEELLNRYSIACLIRNTVVSVYEQSKGKRFKHHPNSDGV